MLAGNPMLRTAEGELRRIRHRFFGKTVILLPSAEHLVLVMTSVLSRTISMRVNQDEDYEVHSRLVGMASLESPDHQSHVAYSTLLFEPYYEPLASRHVESPGTIFWICMGRGRETDFVAPIECTCDSPEQERGECSGCFG